MLHLLVFFSVVSAVLADFHLLLLHTNDMHARFQQTNRYCDSCDDDNSTSCYGGFARLHSEVSRLKQEAARNNQSAIFLNAGDTFQGTPYFSLFKSNITSKFTNMLTNLDVMCLGNHEFDEGIATIASFIASSNITMVCSNLDTSQEPSMRQPNLVPSVVLDLNGTMVGIVGYLTPSTSHMSKTEKLQILDEIPSIRDEARKLLAQNVNIIIALGHSGYDKDMEIAKYVPEIDVVVGGHSHTFLYTGPPPDIEKAHGPYPTVVTQDSGKQVPVVQAFYATKYLGRMELDFDDLGNLKAFSGSPLLLDGNKPQDPAILRELRPYEMNISAAVHRVVGRTDVLLDGRSCRYHECNLGNLIADAFVDYAKRKFSNPRGWTVAAVGFINAGGIRDNIDTRHNLYHNGSIMMGDVMQALPFSNNIVIINLPGRVIVEALEYAIQYYGTSGTAPKTLQLSGLKVVYNVNATVGHRVVNVTVRCADCQQPAYYPLNPSQVYSVVTGDFIANGGSGFTMFTDFTDGSSPLDVDYQVVSEYIELQGVVNPALEGRITLVHGVPSAATRLITSLHIVCLLLFCLFKHISS